MDPRIRIWIHTKISWIRNTGTFIMYVPVVYVDVHIALDLLAHCAPAGMREGQWATRLSTARPPGAGSMAALPRPPHSPNTKHTNLIDNILDEIIMKATNPKCRLYWCSIEFIDWRYSQSCWYFRPAL
jgi:hypothetical protein